MEFILITVITVVLTLSFYGMGAMFVKLAREEIDNHTLFLPLGLCFYIFCGGLLNVLSLAYTGVLGALIFTGLILSASRLKNYKNVLFKPGQIWVYIVIVLITVFQVYTQTTPSAFNLHDDFEKYFAHPVRMMQSGTLAGSPLNAIGTEVIGGQTIIHSLILTFLPVKYINYGDSILCLFLALLLVASLKNKDRSPLLIILSIILLYIINPQYTNISALYSATLLVITLFVIEDGMARPSSILTGLLYATIISLKITFLPFVLFHFMLSLFMKRDFQHALSITKYTLLFFLPWLVLHLPTYVGGLSTGSNTLEFQYQFKKLFSMQPLDYGGSFIKYSSLAIILLLLPSIAYFKRKQLQIAHPFSAAFSYFSILVIFGSLHSDYEVALRFAIPVLIAGSVTTLATTNLLVKSHIVEIVLAIIMILVFFPEFKSRAEQAFDYGNMLSFKRLATNIQYLEYNDYVLNGQRKDEIEELQAMIPGGAKVLAWVMTPFYLDYSTHDIVDVEPAGLNSPGAYLPVVDYVIWEHTGYAVRTPTTYQYLMRNESAYVSSSAYKAYNFTRYLESVGQSHEVIFRNNSFAVYRVQER